MGNEAGYMRISDSAVRQSLRMDAAEETVCCRCRELKKKVRELDFAIIDVTEYLDVYPDCSAARENLAKWRSERAEAAADYESACGMLTMFGVCGASGTAQKYQPWEYQAD